MIKNPQSDSLPGRSGSQPGTRPVLFLIFILLTTPLLSGFSIDPSQSQVVFRQVSIEEGLSNTSINHIFQDSQGFLWISTADGLNRYDGYSMTVFRHDPGDPNSIAGNWIGGLYEDSRQNLWILFGIGGLDRYDRDRNRFEHHSHIEGDATSLAHQAVVALAEDLDGVVWVATSGGGLDRIVERVGEDGDLQIEFERGIEAPDPQDHTSVPTWITRLLPDANGDLWIGTADAGLFLRERSGQLHHIAADVPGIQPMVQDDNGTIWFGSADGLHRIENRTVYDITTDIGPVLIIRVDQRGRPWFLTGNRLFRHDPETGSVQDCLTELRSKDDPASRPLTIQIPPASSNDDSEYVAIGTAGGLILWDLDSDTYQVQRRDPGNPRSLQHNRIVALKHDRTGLLWIGSWGAGVHMLNKRAMRFPHFRIPETDLTPNSQFVESILEDRDGRLWLGTADGLTRFDSESGLALHYRHDPRNPTSIRPSMVVSLLQLRDGSFVIGTRTGLDHIPAGQDLDAPDVQFDHVSLPNLDNLPVNSFSESKDGRVWIGSNQGLYRFDPKTGSVEQHGQHRDPSRRLLALHVETVLEDLDGTVWLGTYVGGLSRYTPSTGTFKHFHFAPGDHSTPNNKSVNTLFNDSCGRLWVGTYSGGLNLFDRETETFTYYTERDGLSGNKINGILEDDSGYLWISTNKGLSRMNPESGEFKNYDIHDGLQSNEFANGSCLKNERGELLFGGPNGFNRFLPDAIFDNPSPPSIAVTAFRKYGEVARLPGARTGKFDIELDPGDDFVSFEFVALDFGNPQKNRYAYQLEGFDPEWVECGTRRYAAYTNLDPGQYTFRVKGCNSDGVWNEEGVSYSILIHPPFYRTSWFYLLAGTMLVLTTVGGHVMRVRHKIQKSLEHERIRVAERERVREQISHDYHDELGHKLTKISLFTELIKRNVGGEDPALTGYVNKVAESIASLTRETRDFVWTLNPRKDSLYEIGLYLQEFGMGLFEDTDIEFTVRGLEERLRETKLSVERKRHLTLMLKEALNNSLEHAECDHVELEFDTGSGHVAVSVIDDGRGFDPDSLSSNVGRGQGLENMRRRAENLGGTLVISERGGGGTLLRFESPAAVAG